MNDAKCVRLALRVGIAALVWAGASACGSSDSVSQDAEAVVAEPAHTKLKCGKGLSAMIVSAMLAPSAFEGELAADTPEEALNDERSRIVKTKSGLNRSSGVVDFERSDVSDSHVKFMGRGADGAARSMVSVVSRGKGGKWLVEAESVCGRAPDPKTVGVLPRPQHTIIPTFTPADGSTPPR